MKEMGDDISQTHTRRETMLEAEEEQEQEKEEKGIKRGTRTEKKRERLCIRRR